MKQNLPKLPPEDLAKLDFWQLRGLYARLMMSGVRTRVERDQLSDVMQRLDDLYGPAWRVGREPVLH
ncbi:hypothetical protein CLV78_103283 [Aliiruegeria haliotis]|uniref:Uncharacterized protein n=1 Tax=Aliiruegeria haliotis TaxID=1280846 RepID=A0A2T0RTG1_9RHOB|nr:hypothetical protein [Aliiruegeria haliotis]PRY24417.1 hypothetical protein CLV78_103283 [Aliiruegeria haliotis]